MTATLVHVCFLPAQSKAGRLITAELPVQALLGWLYWLVARARHDPCIQAHLSAK